jgi:hypothetical protein
MSSRTRRSLANAASVSTLHQSRCRSVPPEVVLRPVLPRYRPNWHQWRPGAICLSDKILGGKVSNMKMPLMYVDASIYQGGGGDRGANTGTNYNGNICDTAASPRTLGECDTVSTRISSPRYCPWCERPGVALEISYPQCVVAHLQQELEGIALATYDMRPSVFRHPQGSQRLVSSCRSTRTKDGPHGPRESA